MTNLTNEEITAINSWTSPLKEYRYIKGVLNKTYNGPLKSLYLKRANTLIELFQNYTDNTYDKPLYRGDVLENIFSYPITNNEIYNNYLKNNPEGKTLTFDTISSFTLSKETAINSYKNSDKMLCNDTPSILYILRKRKSVFLDISKHSFFENEKEVLCNIGIKFTVMDIEEKENNHLIYYLDEC